MGSVRAGDAAGVAGGYVAGLGIHIPDPDSHRTAAHEPLWLEPGLVWYSASHEHCYWSVYSAGGGESDGYHPYCKYPPGAHLGLGAGFYCRYGREPAAGRIGAGHCAVAARQAWLCGWALVIA